MDFITANIHNMRPIKTILADNVLTLRTDRGLSQKELADMLGMHQSSVARIEGALHEPLKVTLAALARVFNVTIEDLINEDILKKKQIASITAAELAQKRTEDLLMNIGGLKFNIVALENQVENLKYQLEAKDMEIDALKLELAKLKK